jgi:hypothetical protein
MMDQQTKPAGALRKYFGRHLLAANQNEKQQKKERL